MIERAYTLTEIDSMREAIMNLTLILNYPFGSGYSRFPNPENSKDKFYLFKEFEEKLRTYMQAGVDPKDLIKSAEDHIEQLKFEDIYYHACDENHKFELKKKQSVCVHKFVPLETSCSHIEYTWEGKWAKFKCEHCDLNVESMPSLPSLPFIGKLPLKDAPKRDRSKDNCLIDL